jgi:uncharacterized protein
MESSRMNPSNALTAVPKIGFGQVRHARLKPVQHAFNYATYFLMLPMRSLASGSATSLKRNRWAALSFYDKDHGDGRENSLAWLDELLATEGIDDATGEVWLTATRVYLATPSNQSAFGIATELTILYAPSSLR